MNWYALFVETGTEETIQKYLSYHYSSKVISIIPKRKVPEKRNGKYYSVLKKLFPGYILLKADMNHETYYTIKQIPHVIKILGSGIDCCPISDNEICILLELIGEDGIIDCSRIYFKNSMIYIEKGPLKGFEYIVKKINKHTNRVKISLNFLGEPRFIDVEAEIIYDVE